MLAPWTLSDAVNIDESMAEMVRTAGSRIVLIQGAPDNEVVRLINAVARSLSISHQGQLLKSARDYLVIHGFGHVSFQRIRARFTFPERDVSQRCAAAADFLISLWHRDHPQRKEMTEIIRHRLQLLFHGHEHSIGCDMMALVATRLPN